MKCKKNRGESAFSTCHHLMIVVRDLKKAVEYYEKIGIGPFKPYAPLREYKKLNVKDKDAFYKLKIKVATLGPIELQVCEPGPGESIYRDFLEKKGEGVQHLGFVVNDIEKEESQMKEKGFRVLNSGRRVDGSGFTYFDTEASAGVTLLIRQNPRKSRI
jgi:methylmalonyl-CoA/ethylmalonyl-CoA epimerase